MVRVLRPPLDSDRPSSDNDVLAMDVRVPPSPRPLPPLQLQPLRPPRLPLPRMRPSPIQNLTAIPSSHGSSLPPSSASLGETREHIRVCSRSRAVARKPVVQARIDGYSRITDHE